MIYAYKGQTLEDHVRGMMEHWEKIKGKYALPIRIGLKALGYDIDEEEMDQIMKVLIVLHDIGKASKVYQNYIQSGNSIKKKGMKGYRHEIISSYYGAKILESKYGESHIIPLFGALTILMHHEPIMMGNLKSYDRRFLGPEEIHNMLNEYERQGGMVEDVKNWLKSIMSDLNLNEFCRLGHLPDNPRREEIEEKIFDIIVKGRYHRRAHALRLLVGRAVIPLVYCDYLSAENRGDGFSKFSMIIRLEVRP